MENEILEHEDGITLDEANYTSMEVNNVNKYEEVQFSIFLDGSGYVNTLNQKQLKALITFLQKQVI